MAEQFIWGSNRFALRFEWGEDAPVRVTGIVRGASVTDVHALPLVEVVTAAAGHRPAADRLVHTETGARLRRTGHTETRTGAGRVLTLTQAADGIQTATAIELLDAADGAFRARTTVTATGDTTLVLRSVATWTMGFTRPGDDRDDFAAWSRVNGVSDWFGEGRWTRTPCAATTSRACPPNSPEEATTPAATGPRPPTAPGPPAATSPSPDSKPTASPSPGRSSTTAPGAGNSAKTSTAATSASPDPPTPTTPGPASCAPTSPSPPSPPRSPPETTSPAPSPPSPRSAAPPAAPTPTTPPCPWSSTTT
nr:hypothetical protein GCM10025732_36770 [Glycomyces mayteni]